MLPALSVKKKKKRILRPSSHHIAASLMVSPEGAQGRNRKPVIDTAADNPHNRAPWGDSGWQYRPQTAEVHIKGTISMSPDLHLPIQRKALNSLTWDDGFSLINSNLLMFWFIVFVAKSPLYCVPPLPLQSSLSEVRCCDVGLSPQFCIPNKTRFLYF